MSARLMAGAGMDAAAAFSFPVSFVIIDGSEQGGAHIHEIDLGAFACGSNLFSGENVALRFLVKGEGKCFAFHGRESKVFTRGWWRAARCPGG